VICDVPKGLNHWPSNIVQTCSNTLGGPGSIIQQQLPQRSVRACRFRILYHFTVPGNAMSVSLNSRYRSNIPLQKISWNVLKHAQRIADVQIWGAGQLLVQPINHSESYYTDYIIKPLKKYIKNLQSYWRQSTRRIPIRTSSALCTNAWLSNTVSVAVQVDGSISCIAPQVVIGAFCPFWSSWAGQCNKNKTLRHDMFNKHV